MIDLVQWRAIIGCYQSSSRSTRTKKHVNNDGIGCRTNCKNNITFRALPVLVLFISHILTQSGDVELNPGPKTSNAGLSTCIDNKPSVSLLMEWLDPLVEWQSFGLSLPEITCTDIRKIELEKPGNVDHQKIALYEKWLQVCPEASWRDIINALEKRKENKLLQDIRSRLQGQLTVSSTLSDAPEDMVCDDDPKIISRKRCNEDTATHSSAQKYAKTTDAREDTLSRPVSENLMYVQEYAEIMKERYLNQTKSLLGFFGPLSLVEKQEVTPKTNQKISESMIKGLVDKTSKLPGHKEITIEDILQPSGSQSLGVVVDGPPGIGKTELCRQLLKMWANEQLTHQQYDLVLYCPLRKAKIAQASTLADLFLCECHEVPKVTEWFLKKNGKGLLTIFDGWDEVSTDLEQSSLVARIIRREQLVKCSVLVTSRSHASSSLLKEASGFKHIQIIGFSEKQIAAVIEKKLENEPQILKKLLNDLEVRRDIQSLCYVPLLCSMVISVYQKSQSHLSTTLTELYESFILQTITRDEKTPCFHEPKRLDDIPANLTEPFKKICQFAYLNLKDGNNDPFFSPQLDHLGLMTTYDSKKTYQFLHLSIQEFLAAWWISKHENTEEVFDNHFKDGHFHMCLRFVAGLTHLEHKNYEKHFIKPLDLQCKKKPLFGFETFHRSWFYQNPDMRINIPVVKNGVISCCVEDFDKLPIVLLQLLYESQNMKLCQLLAQSITNHSLCLFHVTSIVLDTLALSLFDMLCISYFINNSNVPWSYLNLGMLSEKQLSILTNELIHSKKGQRRRSEVILKTPEDEFSKQLSAVFLRSARNSQSSESFIDPPQNQCKILEIVLKDATDESIHKLVQPSFLRNINECYCGLCGGQYTCHVILDFLSLPQIQVLHLNMRFCGVSTNCTDNYLEIEKCLERNSTLKELKFDFGEVSSTIIVASLIKGVAGNETITSFSLFVHAHDYNSSKLYPTPLTVDTIEQLLKRNNTLQYLALNLPDHILPSFFNITKINTPLIALETQRLDSTFCELTTLLPHAKGLYSLTLHKPHQLHVPLLFHNLQELSLPLDTTESVIELFIFLQSNNTLKALRVEIGQHSVIFDETCTSLQNMLKQNQSLQYLEIETALDHPIPTFFSDALTNGLTDNTSLQELSVPIPLNERMSLLFEVIFHKTHLTELQVNFRPDQSCSDSSDEEKKQTMTSLFYEQGLPIFTNMLKSHTRIRLLKIECSYFNNSSQSSHWNELVANFYEAIFCCSSSLKYLEFGPNIWLYNTVSFHFNNILKEKGKALITKYRQAPDHC